MTATDIPIIALCIAGLAATVALFTIAVFHAGRMQDDDYADWADWADRRGDGE